VEACEAAVTFAGILEYDTQKITRSILKVKLSLCLSRALKDMWGIEVKFCSILPSTLGDTKIYTFWCAILE
jgi:hypothetical protein